MLTGEQNAQASATLRNFRALPSLRKPLEIVLACSLGWLIWNSPADEALNANSVQFLATLVTALILWISNTFDEYVVAFMLLASWVLLKIVPPAIALDGFSHESWFFVIAALGIGAAVGKSGLLRRLAIQILRHIPISAYRSHSLVLFLSGLAMTPLLPMGKARAVVALPISQALAQATGFPERSNGSAALGLSAMIGFSHMGFAFLTGGEFCLLGWNLLPAPTKAEFGWFVWFLAALPVSIFVFVFVFCSIHLLFPLSAKDRGEITTRAGKFQVDNLPPLSDAEWIALAVLLATLVGWVTVTLHGIGETWIALLGLLAFLSTGVLDKKTFKNDVDWSLVLFFGIVNSMAIVSRHLKVDQWLVASIAPVLGSVTLGPGTFLTAVVIIVFGARFFLRKTAVALILPLVMMPYGQELGIHPGIIVITIVAASECFLLTYQDGSYQIAYSSTNGGAFTHCQARKALTAKLAATILAIAISVPYWTMLGLIR